MLIITGCKPYTFVITCTTALTDLHTKFSGTRRPTGPNSFVFTYIFSALVGGPRPPKWVQAPLRKILDLHCPATPSPQDEHTPVSCTLPHPPHLTAVGGGGGCGGGAKYSTRLQSRLLRLRLLTIYC